MFQADSNQSLHSRKKEQVETLANKTAQNKPTSKKMALTSGQVSRNELSIKSLPVTEGSNKKMQNTG